MAKPLKKDADPIIVKDIMDNAESLRDPKVSLKRKVKSFDKLIDEVLDLYQEITPETQPWMFPSLKKWVHGHKRPDGTWSRGYWADVENED